MSRRRFTMQVVTREPLRLVGTTPAGRPWEYRADAHARRWSVELDSSIIAGSGDGAPALPLALALVVDALQTIEGPAAWM